MHAARLVLGASLLTSVLAGCGRDTPAPAPSAATVARAPAAPAAPAPGAPAVDEGGTVSGTVLETMDAGGYTYAKLDRGGDQVWVAGPQTRLAVGATIEHASGTLMTGFRSNTLDRTFDQIYFLSSFGGAAAAQPARAPAAQPAPTEMIAPPRGGMTIAGVFANKVGLAGKPVAVRGKVVKVNNGILGRNWVHVQDGTGAAGTDDLLVTTAATAALGDIVTVRGTLATDKDFGGGYTYDVVVEDAAVTAE